MLCNAYNIKKLVIPTITGNGKSGDSDHNRKWYKSEEKRQYQYLLKEQIFWLNRHKNKLLKNSKTLYNKYLNNTLDYKIKSRCCNFPLLEEKCIKYNSKINC